MSLPAHDLPARDLPGRRRPGAERAKRGSGQMPADRPTAAQPKAVRTAVLPVAGLLQDTGVGNVARTQVLAPLLLAGLTPAPVDSVRTTQRLSAPTLSPGRLQNVRRKPADFAASPALQLEAGYGFLAIFASPWAKIIEAINSYTKLPEHDYPAQAKALSFLLVLIADWESHHQVGKESLTKDEQDKLTAIKALRTLIDAQHRVDNTNQAAMAPRFKGDFLLEQVMMGNAVFRSGEQGMHVTRVQQAFADLRVLLPNEVTGVIGPSTVVALRTIQRNHNLFETGIVDQETFSLLQKKFRGHRAEIELVDAIRSGPKARPGEYNLGAAPPALKAGTRDLGPEERQAAQQVIKTSKVAGAGGTLPTFAVDLPGRGRYGARLKALILTLIDGQYNRIGKGKGSRRDPAQLVDWKQIEAVAAKSKAVTDAVFGKFAVGPPLKQGAGIHDAWDDKLAQLQSDDDFEAAADWRVRKLLTGSAEVRDLDIEHGALQHRPAERTIVDRVKATVINERRAELIEIHKGWSGYAENGEVFIQRFKKPNSVENCDVMWRLFHTVVHEYLHTLEHSRSKDYTGRLKAQAGQFTLREGITEYFTYIVLGTVNYDSALRVLVEGEHHTTDAHPIPQYVGYKERINAERLAGVVGANNVMAAYFLGEIEKIGAAP
jgi:peptidoglycan hydrolase-like protein with peptidoglycan-binding domain